MIDEEQVYIDVLKILEKSERPPFRSETSKHLRGIRRLPGLEDFLFGKYSSNAFTWDQFKQLISRGIDSGDIREVSRKGGFHNRIASNKRVEDHGAIEDAGKLPYRAGPVATQKAELPTLRPPSHRNAISVAGAECAITLVGHANITAKRHVYLIIWKGDGSLAIHDEQNVLPLVQIKKVRTTEAGQGYFTVKGGDDRLNIQVFQWLWFQQIDCLPPDHDIAKESCRALVRLCKHLGYSQPGQIEDYRFKKGERACPVCGLKRPTCKNHATDSGGLCTYHSTHGPVETLDQEE